MKIVYLLNSAVPSQNANSLQVVNMCNEISNLIGKVFLIAPNTGSKKSISEHYGINKNFELIKIKKFKKLPRGLNYYLFSVYSIILGLSYKPDIFITRNYFTLFLLILLRKKVIFEVHTGLEFEGRFNNFIVKNFNILNSKKILNLVFITKSLKNFFFKEYKIRPKNCCVLSSASNLKFYYPKPRQYQGNFKIGYFGLLNKSRGTDFIFKLSHLDAKNKYYIFGGDKAYINKIKKKIFHRNIILKEYLPYKKIKKMMNEMDLLILPYEKKVSAGGNFGDISQFTSPMKLFDYLASSKPIMASSLPVLREILTNKKNCIFLSDLNIYKWKLAIEKLSRDFSLREIISKNNFYLSREYTYNLRVKKCSKV